MAEYYSEPIDYDSFPAADLTLDEHWIVVSKPIDAQRQAAAAAAREKEFLAAQPDHKIILIPADPNYRPRERELWPLVNQAIMECLRPHTELFDAVQRAARDVIHQYRGWCNPDPARWTVPVPQT